MQFQSRILTAMLASLCASGGALATNIGISPTAGPVINPLNGQETQVWKLVGRSSGCTAFQITREWIMGVRHCAPSNVVGTTPVGDHGFYNTLGHSAVGTCHQAPFQTNDDPEDGRDLVICRLSTPSAMTPLASYPPLVADTRPVFTNSNANALGQLLVLSLIHIFNIPLVTSNRINTPEVAEQVLADGCADMVSMARPLLADAHFVKKAAQGKADEINTCIACNQACLDHIFRNKLTSCLVNPRACHETELVFHKTPARRKLAVVGAGPSGLTAATLLAERGHEVHLFDAASESGGQLNMAKQVPGKEEFHEMIRYFGKRVQLTGVHLHLDTRVDAAALQAYDEVIVATGVNPRDPKIPGQDHPKVLSYIDVLRHKKPVRCV